MSLKIGKRMVGTVTVIDCTGRITLGEGTSTLRDSIRETVNSGQTKILLNLGEVNYLDASGIGELISAFTTVVNQGGQLKLLSINERIQKLLHNTKLHTVFEYHDDEPAAIRSF